MSREELLDIGIKFRGGAFPNETWESLNVKYNKPFASGESFRSFVKKELKKQNKLPSKEDVKTEEINQKLTEVDIQLANLQKEKQKLRDQRTEYNRILREESRDENLKDLIIETIANSNIKPINVSDIKPLYGQDEMIISLSDIHYGLNVDNEFEKYNPDIFVERLTNYTSQILEIQQIHKINTCHLALLGDEISGILHNTIRVSNTENVVSQVQNVSEYITKFIENLANHFETINIYHCSGNHSRIFQDKKESINSERLENFVIWYLEARFSNVKSVVFHKSMIDNTLVKAHIKDKLCVFAHGDNDSPTKMAENITMLLEEKPHLCLFGHMHHYMVDTKQRVKLVMSGAFVVSDEYCLNKRILGEPSQAVIIMGNNGYKCSYDCKLNNSSL